MSLEKAPKIEFPDSYSYQYDPVRTPPSFSEQICGSPPIPIDYRDHNLNGSDYADKLSPVAMVEEAAKKRENRLFRD